MSIKKSQAILKCFYLKIPSLAFGLRWAQKTIRDETMLRDTSNYFLSSTAGQGFQNTKWPAVLYSP